MSKHKIKFNLKNYKLLKDFSLDLEDSNLYLIRGENKTGKTSVLQAILSLLTIKNNVPDAISEGEHFAKVEGEIPGPDGKYFVHMDISKNTTAFTMFDPNGRKISRISDMRNVLSYSSMTVEDFIKKSYSTEGRREQIKILATLLDALDSAEFSSLLANVDTRKGKYFIERKAAKSDYESKELLHKANEISNEDHSFYNESSDFKEMLQQLRANLVNLSKIPSKEAEMTMLTNQYESRIELLRGEKFSAEEAVEYNERRIKDLEAEIIRVNAQTETRIAKLASINHSILKEQDDYKANKAASDAREDSTEEIEALTTEINDLELKQERFIKLEDKVKAARASAIAEINALEILNTKEEKLENARARLLELIKKISIPGIDLQIKEDLIHLNGYQMDENQVADSELIIAVSAILAKVNHKSPILVVGKLRELDDKSLQQLEQIAIDNDCVIIGDYVTDGLDEIVVEGVIHEEVKKEELPKGDEKPKSNNILDTI